MRSPAISTAGAQQSRWIWTATVRGPVENSMVIHQRHLLLVNKPISSENSFSCSPTPLTLIEPFTAAFSTRQTNNWIWLDSTERGKHMNANQPRKYSVKIWPNFENLKKWRRSAVPGNHGSQEVMVWLITVDLLMCEQGHTFVDRKQVEALFLSWVTPQLGCGCLVKGPAPQYHSQSMAIPLAAVLVSKPGCPLCDWEASDPEGYAAFCRVQNKPTHFIKRRRQATRGDHPSIAQFVVCARKNSWGSVINQKYLLQSIFCCGILGTESFCCATAFTFILQQGPALRVTHQLRNWTQSLKGYEYVIRKLAKCSLKKKKKGGFQEK